LGLFLEGADIFMKNKERKVEGKMPKKLLLLK
jgi:hypothetical protein